SPCGATAARPDQPGPHTAGLLRFRRSLPPGTDPTILNPAILLRTVAQMAQQLFPVTVVGSWTRPEWLIHALRRRQANEITADEFNRIADDAVLAAIKYQEDAGVDIVADGEMRRDNFYSFVVEKLSGMRLMKLSELLDYMKDRAGFEEILRGLDVPAFAIKSPIAVDRVRE